LFFLSQNNDKNPTKKKNRLQKTKRIVHRKAIKKVTHKMQQQFNHTKNIEIAIIKITKIKKLKKNQQQ